MTICQNCQQLVQNLCHFWKLVILPEDHGRSEGNRHPYNPSIGGQKPMGFNQTFALNQSIEHHMCCLNNLKSPF